MSFAPAPMVEPGPYVREDSRRFPREVKIVALVCLVLAVVLRCLRIGYREFVGIEFFTHSFTQGHRPPLMEAVFYGHLPLYYELTRVWASMIGMTNEWALRLPSVAFGLIACVAFFFFAQRYLRGTAFAICLLSFVLNPTLLAASNTASPYALLSIWVVASNYFCIRALDEGGRRNWILYSVASLLGAITHPLFWFVILAQFGFAAARPGKTPRPFVLAGAAGTFLFIIIFITASLLADTYVPRKFDVQAPSIADLARGLVAVVMGNFKRYGYKEHELIRTMLYFFIFVSLALSVQYYRKRAEEARALPENVVWIDETQDVVGTWNRLSLASFLMFQWVTFIVPALGLMLLGSFAPDLELRPEHFIICLPSLLILIAAGIDAAPGRAGTLVMGLILIFTMGMYDSRLLSDTGAGVKRAVEYITTRGYDPQKDAVLYVTYPSISRSVDMYAAGIKGVPFPNKEPDKDTIARLEQAIAGKDRIFVLYHNDVRSKTNRSPVKEWFRRNKSQFEPREDDYELSRDDEAHLQTYRRRAI